jgi:uncharacterized Zn finger protein
MTDAEIDCPSCGKVVTPAVRKEITRRGSIMSFFRYVLSCPKCGEPRIAELSEEDEKNLNGETS